MNDTMIQGDQIPGRVNVPSFLGGGTLTISTVVIALVIIVLLYIVFKKK